MQHLKTYAQFYRGANDVTTRSVQGISKAHKKRQPIEQKPFTDMCGQLVMQEIEKRKNII